MLTQIVWSFLEAHVTPFLEDFDPTTDLSISWYDVHARTHACMQDAGMQDSV
jgi:hypothetical protein